MKCPKCEGKGFGDIYCGCGTLKDCNLCRGTGEIDIEMLKAYHGKEIEDLQKNCKHVFNKISCSDICKCSCNFEKKIDVCKKCGKVLE